VPPDAAILHEEVFGPVTPVVPFNNVDEVVGLANATEYGLAAFVMTRDFNTAMRVSERLEFGMIGINDWYPVTAEAPFGGFKQSGLGRESGVEGCTSTSRRRRGTSEGCHERAAGRAGHRGPGAGVRGARAAVLPHADPSELIDVEDVVESSRIFPEGFFVILDGDRVVGQGAGIFLNFDFERPQHNILSITGIHQCGNHSPDGDWYYGTDIAVHPEYRRRGIGSMLYSLRKELVRKRQKRGMLGGGHMPGFADSQAPHVGGGLYRLCGARRDL
jgi:GNAT superfamily N-acetyltransferase